MAVPTSENMLDDFVDFLPPLFKSVRQHNLINSFVITYRGNRIIKMFFDWMKSMCVDLNRDWKNCNNSIILNGVVLSGSILGNQGTLNLETMNYKITRIYPELSIYGQQYYKIFLDAIEITINNFLNQYYNSYKTVNMVFVGTQTGANYNAVNSISNIEQFGQANESLLSTIEQDVLFRSNFLSNAPFLRLLLDAFASMFRKNFTKYKAETNWQAGSCIAANSPIANGGILV